MATLVDEALAEQRAGHLEHAQQLFHEAARRGDNPGVAWAWIAHQAAEDDDWPAALRACGSALGAADQPWWTHHVQGVALTRLGRAAEAVLPLQRAADLAPDVLAVATAQARCGVAIRDLGLAHNALTRARRIDARAPQTRRVDALIALAEERFRDAERVARSLLLDDVLDIEALTNLGVALVAQGAEAEARPFFRDAMKHGEVTPFHRLTRANLSRLERRIPSPRAPRTRRPLGVLQFSVLRWLLIAVLGSIVVRANPAIGLLILGAIAVALPVLRKRRPAATYRAMPDYVALSVTVTAPPELLATA